MADSTVPVDIPRAQNRPELTVSVCSRLLTSVECGRAHLQSPTQACRAATWAWANVDVRWEPPGSQRWTILAGLQKRHLASDCNGDFKKRERLDWWGFRALAQRTPTQTRRPPLAPVPVCFPHRLPCVLFVSDSACCLFVLCPFFMPRLRDAQDESTSGLFLFFQWLHWKTGYSHKAVLNAYFYIPVLIWGDICLFL